MILFGLLGLLRLSVCGGSLRLVRDQPALFIAFASDKEDCAGDKEECEHSGHD